MDGLACGKVRLIDQLKHLPVRRGLAEAVEHRPAPCGKIQGKGRGICRILTVEGSCKAAHPHLSAVTQGSQAGAQAVQGIPAVQPAALQVAGTHSQRPGREVLHRQIDQRAVQLRGRCIAQQLHCRLAVQQSRFALIAGGQSRARNTGEQGSSQTDCAGTGIFQERAAGQGL